MRPDHVGYAWEQLYGAVSSLACSDWPLRERLLDAVVSRAHKIFPSMTVAKELPDEISERLKVLEASLTKHGSFQESIEKMDDSQVKWAIEEIVSIFSMVAQADGKYN